jgi:hypothetical protein
MRHHPARIDIPTVDLPHIDAALAALGHALASHSAACVCQACTALARAVEEAEALTTVVAFVHGLAENGNYRARLCLQELQEVRR